MLTIHMHNPTQQHKVERWISARAEKQMDLNDHNAKPAWWMECAQSCVAQGCKGVYNDTDTLGEEEDPTVVTVPSRRHKIALL